MKLLIVSSICVMGVGCVGIALSVAAHHTAKYDLWLYTADAALGYPGFAIGRLIRPTLMYPPLVAVYETMPMVLLSVYAVHLMKGGAPERVLAAFAANFGAGYCIYLVLPACGPEYAFRCFPAPGPVLPSLRILHLAAPPSCMPSLHLSTALLAYWFCRQWSLARAAAMANLVLTALATLATGENYVIDLVVAAPFATFVYCASQHAYRQAATWLATVLAWCEALRFGPSSITAAPPVFACTCVLTVAAAWFYVRYMERPSCPWHQQGTNSFPQESLTKALSPWARWPRLRWHFLACRTQRSAHWTTLRSRWSR